MSIILLLLKKKLKLVRNTSIPRLRKIANILSLDIYNYYGNIRHTNMWNNNSYDIVICLWFSRWNFVFSRFCYFFVSRYFYYAIKITPKKPYGWSDMKGRKRRRRWWSTVVVKSELTVAMGDKRVCGWWMTAWSVSPSDETQQIHRLKDVRARILLYVGT